MALQPQSGRGGMNGVQLEPQQEMHLGHLGAEEQLRAHI